MPRIVLLFTLIIALIPSISFSQDADYYFNTGKTHYQAGRYEDALPNFIKYVELKPKEMPPYHWLGWTYYRLSKYSEAIENLDKANMIREAWDTCLGLGECHYSLKDYDKALENFSRAIKLKPDETSPFQWLGYTYYNLQKYNEAIESLIKGDSIKESYSNYNWLGNCYSALEDYESALKYYLKFAELHPENSELWLPHNRLGWNYYYMQMYYDAIEHFKESIKIKPANYSYIGLCKTYHAMGEYDKSREILNTLLNRLETEAEKEQVKFLQGFNHIGEGKYEEAFKVFGHKNTLGIELRSVKNGMKITSVFKNGPAYLAGLKNGDILLEFDGISLQGRTNTDFIANVIPQPVFGSKVKLKVFRDGYTEDKYIYPGVSPEINNLALNDGDLIRQRAQVSDTGINSKLNVAVIELSTHGISEDETAALTVRVRSELFNTNKFNVLEREDMGTILEEQGLQQTGLTMDEKLVQAGKLLNVEYIVGGTISKIDPYYSISLKMIDVETGKLKSMATKEIQGTIADVLVSGIKETVYKLMQ